VVDTVELECVDQQIDAVAQLLGLGFGGHGLGLACRSGVSDGCRDCLP
jgi:hypothetical protein